MESPKIGIGCKVLAKYLSGAFAGNPAIVENKYMKGLTIYQGCWMDDESTLSLLKFAAEHAGLRIPQNADGVTVIKRGSCRFYINHSCEIRILDQAAEGKIILGKADGGKVSLAPYDVCIVEE
jgi:beta-galactosidase GanA